MHVPDGFLDLPTSAATAAVAVGVTGVALVKARTELDDRLTTRAGLTACFVFAAQMVNFPVVSGTSGHLIGAGLAVALLGPWVATVVMACVVIVQALFFADGGLTALGTNVLLLGVVPIWVAYGVAWGVRALVRHRPHAVVPAAAIGAGISVPAAALAFSGLYAVGGAVPVPWGTLVVAMVGTHVAIGVGEGIITALVLAAIVATRPDLVRAMDADRSPAPVGRGVAWGVAASLVVAAGLSLVAATDPDGLESVAENLGFLHAAADSATASSPLADYTVAGLGPVGTSVAGVVGVAVTLGLAWLGLRAVSRRTGTG